jgi:hypothetical protein
MSESEPLPSASVVTTWSTGASEANGRNVFQWNAARFHAAPPRVQGMGTFPVRAHDS